MSRGSATEGGTRERILDAAEELLRRFGPAKTSVVDVARSLGMSHANVYRHFASKADLQDAVTRRWLRRISEPLAATAHGPERATVRLQHWMVQLTASQSDRVLTEPELFATYRELAEQARGVIEEHAAELRRQLAEIISGGVREGDFRVSDAAAAAAILLNGTLRFHHPHFVRATGKPFEERELLSALAVLTAGLRAAAV